MSSSGLIHHLFIGKRRGSDSSEASSEASSVMSSRPETAVASKPGSARSSKPSSAASESGIISIFKFQYLN
jgi:hypothetical protein